VLGLLIAVGVLHVGVAHAVVGMSPSEKTVVVVVGEEAQDFIKLTRANPKEDEFFQVTKGGDASGMLELIGGTRINVQKGQDEFDYQFIANADGAEPGTYEAILTFTAEEAAERGAVNIKIALSARIHIEVRESAQEIATKVTDKEIEFLEISELSYPIGQSFKPGESVQVTWTVVNRADIPLVSAPYEIAVSRRGTTLATQSSATGAMQPGGSEDITWQYTLSEQAKSGRYDVVAKVGDQTLEGEIRVPFTNPLSMMQTILSIIGIASFICGFILVKNDKVDSRPLANLPVKQKKMIAAVLGLLALALLLSLMILWVYNHESLVKGSSRGGITMIATVQPDTSRVTLHELQAKTSSYLEGDWMVLGNQDNHAFAFPLGTERNAENESLSAFYVFVEKGIKAFATSQVPGPIASISESPGGYYMAISGIDIEDGSSYICLSEIAISAGPDCIIATDLIEGEVVQFGWAMDETRMLVLKNEQGHKQTIDPWEGGIVELEKEFVPVNTTQSQDIFSKEPIKTTWFGSLAFFRNGNVFRAPSGSEFYQMTDSRYIMKDKDRNIYFVNAEDGTFELFMENMEQGMRLHQLSEGSLITVP